MAQVCINIHHSPEFVLLIFQQVRGESGLDVLLKRVKKNGPSLGVDVFDDKGFLGGGFKYFSDGMKPPTRFISRFGSL